MITLYGIPNCDTVKRARAWLAQQGATLRFHDFKREGVPTAELDRWLQAAGAERLLNRKGTTWRKLDDGLRAQADTATGARALMLRQPSLIKRPVVDWGGGAITVGFDVAEFERQLAQAA
ncbi:MAG: arsenate reductase [Rubrivivax sp.]|nr:arsenate reductase [Rubrivivax sp.]